MKETKILKIAGSLVVAEAPEGAKIYEVAKVGEEGLVGEVVRIKENQAFIQVYEETSGLRPGEKVIFTGEFLRLELGPGIIGNIYDGIQRPLDKIFEKRGPFIARGIEIPALSREKKWHFVPLLKEGESVREGDILGEVEETPLIRHKILLPPGKKGKIVEIKKEGEYGVEETIAIIENEGKKEEIKMFHRWPVRIPRPVSKKIDPREPLITGQRIIDTLFPVAKGGTACVPGPFGSGKTVIQHQIAKWADADVVIFVGCGERGNEMTDLLMEFPELKDPRSGRPLMEKSILIANTSNMPVAAREASVYTGITLGEYFRDMGYDVVLVADSTSRWAEALREISARLEEMPGEEGYPAYLSSRTSEFYERAGKVKCLGVPEREGSLTVIGAVSPPGGDLLEPVTQATLRVTKVFWRLDDRLASRRHFPAINWLESYSLYHEKMADYMEKKGLKEWGEITTQTMEILSKEASLEEIVKLVGKEALSVEDQFLLEVAAIVREEFLMQNAFDEIDTYTPLEIQYQMIKSIIDFYREGKRKLKEGKTLEEVMKQRPNLLEIKSKKIQ